MTDRKRGRLAAVTTGEAPAGVRAVAAALRYRIAIVQAGAGWGKTTAVRAALGNAPHLWCAPSAGSHALGTIPFSELAAHLAATAREDRIVVVDDAHLLDAHAGSFETLVNLTRYSTTRWVFVSRESTGLPVASWIAAGEAGAPVGYDDLALSSTEVRAAALAHGVRADDAAVAFLLETSAGWPVAVRFALVALERSHDFSRAATTTKRLLYAYFAAEMLPALDAGRREFLSDLAIAGPVDEVLLAALSREDPTADLKWLVAGPAPSFETEDRIALHPVFASFLLAEMPAPQRKARAAHVASALRSKGYLGRAFDLIARYTPENVLDELHVGGFALLDSGHSASVESAIRGLPQRIRRDEAVVVALRAELEAQAGAPERASDLYARALLVAKDPEVRARVCRQRALHLLNQASAEALDAIGPALDQGTDVDAIDALGIHAMALVLSGRPDEARLEARRAIDAATTIDDEGLLARSVQRMSYVEHQSGHIHEAERHAHEAARLAQRIGAWFHFLCAHSVLYSAAGARDDHAAALWHAQQIGFAAERTGDRRHRLYALSAQYVLEVERGRKDRAMAIEAELPALSSGAGDALECCVALAIARSWDGAFPEAVRRLASLDDRIADPSERRLWNAALALFAAFAGDESAASTSLRACGKIAPPLARDDAMINAQADCFAAIAQVFLGHPGAAVRRLPLSGPTAQTRALSSFARELAGLGPLLGLQSASHALQRLRAEGQEGLAQAVSAALAARASGDAAVPLTGAELRVLGDMARGRTAKSIAQDHGRSIHTIRNQIKAVIRKLGTSGSIEAVAMARRLGILT